MNDRTAALRALLKKRRLTIALLADAAGVGYQHLSEVLAGRYPGPRTWKRVCRWTTPEEQRLIVELWGPVFGEDWVDETTEADALTL